MKRRTSHQHPRLSKVDLAKFKVAAHRLTITRIAQLSGSAFADADANAR